MILKSDGFPTYHLAAMVDDHDMQITHVLRGDEWLPQLPKHYLIYQAFGWEPPIFAHLPVILNPSGKGKMSKRKATSADSVFVTEFRDEGYLPEALRNFLAFVGWAPGSGIEKEIMPIEELIDLFDLEHVNPAPAAFPYDKLDWMNGMYIRALPVERTGAAHLSVLDQRRGRSRSRSVDQDHAGYSRAAGDAEGCRRGHRFPVRRNGLT